MAASAPDNPEKRNLWHISPRVILKVNRNSNLRRCFVALVEEEPVNLKLETALFILRTELEINMEPLEPELAKMLPYLLVHYGKTWHGWEKRSDYEAKKISLQEWYERFYRHITYSLEQLINKKFKAVEKDFHTNVPLMENLKKYMNQQIVDKENQTDKKLPRGTAPFSITVVGDATLLNTLKFTNNENGDVLLKEHEPIEWPEKLITKFTTKQLLNWPFVGFLVKTPVFAFERKCMPEYHRKISSGRTPLSVIEPEFISEMKQSNPHAEIKAYSLKYLKSITKDLQTALERRFGAEEEEEISLIKTAIEELLADVVELNITRDGEVILGSHTLISYAIGKRTYYRNKAPKGSRNQKGVCFREYIIPRIELDLFDVADEESFNRHIQDLKDPRNKIDTPYIALSCHFCRKSYSTQLELLTHLREKHKMEEPVVCLKCRKNFGMLNLCATRWHHDCKAEPKT